MSLVECDDRVPSDMPNEPTGVCGLEELKIRLARTREALIDVLVQTDEIELQMNPSIVQDYSVKIGCFENELLKAQIDARRAKRKLALIQARLNSREAPREGEIEAQLDEEFAVWEEDLSKRLQGYFDAIDARASSRVLLPHEVEELKRLHRTLTKRFHPDANVGNEEECRRFFLIAQAAYENGDIELLRSVEVATGHLGKSAQVLSSEAEAAVELELAQARLSLARERLESLRSSNPYLLKEKLEDSEWVARVVSELKERTEEQIRACDYYLQRIEDVKGASHE